MQTIRKDCFPWKLPATLIGLGGLSYLGLSIYKRLEQLSAQLAEQGRSIASQSSRIESLGARLTSVQEQSQLFVERIREWANEQLNPLISELLENVDQATRERQLLTWRIADLEALEETVEEGAEFLVQYRQELEQLRHQVSRLMRGGPDWNPTAELEKLTPQLTRASAEFQLARAGQEFPLYFGIESPTDVESWGKFLGWFSQKQDLGLGQLQATLKKLAPNETSLRALAQRLNETSLDDLLRRYLDIEAKHTALLNAVDEIEYAEYAAWLLRQK